MGGSGVLTSQGAAAASSRRALSHFFVEPSDNFLTRLGSGAATIATGVGRAARGLEVEDAFFSGGTLAWIGVHEQVEETIAVAAVYRAITVTT